MTNTEPIPPRNVTMREIAPRRPSFEQQHVVLLVFAALAAFKLGGVIDWSWWLVTLPLWGGFALIFGIFLIGTIVLGLACLVMVTVEAVDRRLLR